MNANDPSSPKNADFLLHDVFHTLVYAIVNIVLSQCNIDPKINPRTVSQTGEFVVRVSENYTRFWWFEWTKVDTATRKLFLPIISQHGNIFASVKKQIEDELELSEQGATKIIGNVLRKFGLPNAWLLPVLRNNTNKIFDQDCTLIVEHYFTEEFGMHIAELMAQGDKELQKNLKNWIKQVEIYPDKLKYSQYEN